MHRDYRLVYSRSRPMDGEIDGGGITLASHFRTSKRQVR